MSGGSSRAGLTRSPRLSRGERLPNCSASQARSRSAGASGFAPSMTPRSSASSLASDDPPGSPRRPRLKLASISDQASSSIPPTGWEPGVGHPPVAVRWASAQRKIRSMSSAGRSRAAELSPLCFSRARRCRGARLPAHGLALLAHASRPDRQALLYRMHANAAIRTSFLADELALLAHAPTRHSSFIMPHACERVQRGAWARSGASVLTP